MNNVLVCTFGRMQPPTAGHAQLIQGMQQLDIVRRRVGKHATIDVKLFISPNTEGPDNPLSYETRIAAIKEQFPDLEVGPELKAPFEVFTWAYEQGYTHLVMTVGDDRVNDFKRLAQAWRVNNPAVTMRILIGTVRGRQVQISGHLARTAALKGDEKTFRRMLMPALAENEVWADRLYREIRVMDEVVWDIHQVASQPDSEVSQDDEVKRSAKPHRKGNKASRVIIHPSRTFLPNLNDAIRRALIAKRETNK